MRKIRKWLFLSVFSHLNMFADVPKPHSCYRDEASYTRLIRGEKWSVVFKKNKWSHTSLISALTRLIHHEWFTLIADKIHDTIHHFLTTHNFKTTHKLVETLNFQIKIKYFIKKHILFCQNQMPQKSHKPDKYKYYFTAYSEVSSEHLQKPSWIRNNLNQSSQYLLEYAT